jgi:hypothetical protein
MPRQIKNKTRPWNKIHIDRFNWLYNYMEANYENINKDDFIDINKRFLIEFIEENKSWSDSSKESFYFMIARYLYNKNNNDRYSKIYSEKGFELMQKTKLITEKNELDDKEKENYREYDYFINILETLPEPSNLKDHYKKLLLSLLILQPPLRTSYYNTAKLLSTVKDNDKKTNYIYLNRRGKPKAYYIVNKDKASNYKIYSMDKTLNKIELSPELSLIINNSFIKYPRKYLFELDDKPVSDTTLLNWLRKITKIDKINFDMMRSVYITWFYKNNKTFGARETLSRQMRHSQPTASKNYLKVFDEEPNLIITNLKLEKDILEGDIKILKSKMIKCDEIEQKNNKLFKKRRTNILYTINNKGVIPKNNTLELYQIKYDTQNKKYT